MRIAFITPEFVTESYFAGGLAQYLGRFVPALVKRGHHVEVFVIGKEQGRFLYEGATVYRVVPKKWLPLRIANGVCRITGKSRLAKTQRMCSVAKGLDEALRARDKEVAFDIIQATNWMITGFFAVRRPVAPVVIRMSSYSQMCDEAQGIKPTLDKRISYYFERVSLSSASAVYSPSRFLAESIHKITGIKAHVVRPLFYINENMEDDNTAIEKLADWPNYLLFFGRLANYKGAYLLAQAIEPLLEKIPDLNLVMAGPCEKDNGAKRLIDLTVSFPKRARYLGILPQAQLRPVLRKARAVVLPSLMDNLPNTCIEAMGLGKLVIGPKGISFDEMIEDGKSGLLFRMGDAVSLRDTIVEGWKLSESERMNIENAAKIRIKEIASEKAIDDIEKFYERVIADTAR